MGGVGPHPRRFTTVSWRLKALTSLGAKSKPALTAEIKIYVALDRFFYIKSLWACRQTPSSGQFGRAMARLIRVGVLLKRQACHS